MGNQCSCDSNRESDQQVVDLSKNAINKGQNQNINKPKEKQKYSQIQLNSVKKFAQTANFKHEDNINNKYTMYFKILDDQFAGEGIFQSYAYISYIDSEQIEKCAEAFWESKIENSKKMWLRIKNAIELRNQKISKKILQKVGLYLVNKNVQLMIDYQGNMYQIPAFCLNPPLQFFETKLIKDFQLEKMNINLRSTFGDDLKIEVDTNTLTKTVKQIFIKEKDIEEDTVQKIRILYSGKELLDEKQLGHYDIKPKSTLIVSLVLKQKEQDQKTDK